MARRPLPRHLALYVHRCPITGERIGLERALRWSPVSKRPARQRPPICSVCGAALVLKTTSYQSAVADDWDSQLERTRLILKNASERDFN